MRKTFFLLLCLTSFQVGFAKPFDSQKRYTVQGVSGALQKIIAQHLSAIPFNPETTSQIRAVESKQTIRQILEAYGYFYSNVQSEIQNTAEKEHIIYKISTGTQLPITELNIQLTGEGKSNPQLKKIVKQLSAKKGTAMTTENYQRIKENLYQSAISEGYLDAIWQTHTVAIDLKKHTAEITLVLDTQPRYTIGSIQLLENPYPLSSGFVRDYLGFKTKDPYRLHEILQSQTTLQKSNYFKDALIEVPATHNTYQMPLNVTLNLAPKYYTLLSLGLRSDLGIRAKAEGLIRYLNTQGHQLSGMLETSRNDFRSLISYQIPGTLPATQQHHLQIKCKSQYPTLANDNDFFSINHYIPRTLPSQNPTVFLRYLYTHQYSIWNVDAFASLHYESFKLDAHLPSNIYYGLIPGVRIHKKQTNWFKDTHNYKLSFKAEGATPLLSTASFLKLEAKGDYFGYLSPWLPSSYLVLRARGGILSTHALEKIPTSLRFHAGGDIYPRGYKKYRLGEKTLAGSLETRLHLMGLFYLSPFIEGNWDTIHHIKASAGCGICLWYPHIGTIEVSIFSKIINPDTPHKHWNLGFIAKITTDLE